MSVTLVVTSNERSPDAGAAAAPPSQSLTFDQPRIVLGRGAHADVRLPSRAVSDTHAIIRCEAGDLSITDEGSTNGTAVNGVVLVRGRRRVLRAGDRVAVPGFELLVQPSLAQPDPPDRTATVARKLLAEALAAVGGEAAPPELALLTSRRAGTRWKLPPPPSRLTAGRGDVCEIVLDDADCSRQHAEFVRDADGVTVRDLGSKNGVVVGERRVTERRLRDGDQVQLGRSVLAFVDPTDELLRAFDGGADEPAAVLPAPRPSAPPPVAAEPSTARDASGASADGRASASPDAPGEPGGSAAERLSRLVGGADGEPAVGTGGAGASAPRSASPPQPGRSAPRPRRDARTADWIVIALAVVILGVSVAALYLLLRGTPLPAPR